MPLIKSISGIRGTIGGMPGENLTPLDILKFSAAFGVFVKQKNTLSKTTIIIGRDSRISGEMVKNLVIGVLLSQGINVVDIGMAATPTVEMAVIQEKAQGGIILSASHNPQGWNALKLINDQGEFLSQNDGEILIQLAEQDSFCFVPEENLGSYLFNPFLSIRHLEAILSAPLVDKNIVAAANFKIVIDGINSVGGVVVPELLKMLGVKNIIELNCDPTGRFAHQPEPLAQNLTQISNKVKETKADLGIVVDPDVDRLAFIDENGEMISEEYTLVMVANYILENFSVIEVAYPGQYQKTTSSNLSSSRALKDIAEKHRGGYEAAAVGEVNVVEKMKQLKAVIGGEGNGGVIYSLLHYGRDALIGTALFLSALAKSQKKISEFKAQLPEYFMVKDKIALSPDLDLVELLKQIKENYKKEKIIDIDGVRIDWSDSWVHLRASNTEPIIRIYAEAKTFSTATKKVDDIKNEILAYIKQDL